MDVKEYISSGMLESYVLGSLSEKEMQEVQCMSNIYPEIKEELMHLQLSLEKYADANALAPPSQIKSKVLEEIERTEQDIPVKPDTTSASKSLAESQPEVVSKSDKKVIPLFYKVAAAASIILIVVVAALWVNLNQSQNEMDRISSNQEIISQQNQELKQELAALEEENQSVNEVNKLLAQSSTERVELAGTENSPNSSVFVYWNKESKEVLLRINQLPKPEDSKQYQLWAIVDGKPQDMGVFEFDDANQKTIRMPYKVKNAQAFAITLEKEGGNPTPTMEAMYVIGNV